MFDPKRPLDAVPGLLLMAALILFGMTVGVAVALAYSWVELKDSIANFLGGVVGAGLGSALAVLGAVYVQRRDRRDRLEAPRNIMSLRATDLRDSLVRFGSLLTPGSDSPFFDDEPALRARIVLNQIPFAHTQVGSLPDGAELSTAIHMKAVAAKAWLPGMLDTVQWYLESDRENWSPIINMLSRSAEQIAELLEEVERLR
jgi:hypothetical protein